MVQGCEMLEQLLREPQLAFAQNASLPPDKAQHSEQEHGANHSRQERAQ